jgi:putative acetyltransferase
LGNSLIVRCENGESGERSAIRLINEAAFGRPDEADLVDNLRSAGAGLISLVAEIDRRVVGHLLFSRMWIDHAGDSIPAVALAPIAVVPAHQRKGIGGRLIRHGLELLRASGERIVIVLGDPGYYARFGFASESTGSLESPFPPEAFMATELSPGALLGVAGRVRYPVAFGIDK